MIDRVHRFDVSRTRAFRSVRSLILDALEGTVEASSHIDLRKRTELMLQLENEVVALIADSELGAHGLGALQFPVNVRMMGPRRADEVVKPFGTEHLHCDLWSGAPPDSFNFFLYVDVTPSCPQLALFETLPSSHPSASYRGPYADTPLRRDELVPVELACFAGHLACFPTLTPHQTIRSSPPEGFRVSVDFRARRESPYAFEDEDAFSADKMNSLGVYWSFPPNPFQSLEEKIAHELSKARAHGERALRARMSYLAKHFPEASIG